MYVSGVYKNDSDKVEYWEKKLKALVTTHSKTKGKGFINQQAAINSFTLDSFPEFNS